MSDIAIRVEGLGKRYRIGERERYKALRDVISDAAAAPFRKLRSTFTRKGHSSLITHDSSPENGNGHPSLITHNSSPENGNGHLSRVTHNSSPENGNGDSSLITHNSSLLSPPSDLFWALKDVSFEVKRGEVVGIIGRNGAGKSTLLKILSRITAPTEGEVEIKGRVGSLLEVGTGFHPELTGRENIYLNGAILGMKRAEIKRKFDEMVAFAEIEKFIDTPVKRYSSGMYVRLAFAVAAHLDPEILVVDEVLAVGDAQFQKKCLGKMGDVAKEGRTVLFVSHNMAAVQGLCSVGILLDQAAIRFRGTVRDAASAYLALDVTPRTSAHRVFSEKLSLTRFKSNPTAVRQHERMAVEIELTAVADEVISDLALLIHVRSGERVALIDLRSNEGPYRLSAGSRLTVTGKLEEVPFVENEFDLGLYVNSDSTSESFMNLLSFSVLPSRPNGQLASREAQFRGLVELKTQIRHAIT